MREPVSIEDLDCALSTAGLSLSALRARCSAVALFGSRASGLSRSSSDWDLLCIGEARAIKTRTLDIVAIGEEVTSGERWLGGDLAGHVLAHGVWLHGAPSWGGHDLRFERAVERKIERLSRRIVAINQVWEGLRPAYRRKHALLVRRDVQRLDRLLSTEPVPPTAELDRAWQGTDKDKESFASSLMRLGAEPSIAAQVTGLTSG